MTTEKILILQVAGLLDDDILSRFHIVIELPQLEPSEQLSLWRTLITKSQYDITMDKEELLEFTKEYGEDGWNARKIQTGTWQES